MSFVNVIEYASGQLIDPDAAGDWTGVFRDAIVEAVNGGHAGVLVPSRPAPYLFLDPGNAPMSIDLRGRHDFTLLGEGPGSVLAMDGPAKSWRLIHIGDATDVVVRDLCLDASRAVKVIVPGEKEDDQLHLVVIGASSGRPEGARRISIIDCTLREALSDGVAIAPESSPDPENEFSDIIIAGCNFLGNRRSGVSNQRLATRVSILHNRFEGTKNADIDMEPSGHLANAGPSGYLILGNTMVRTGLSESVSLSGISPESRSRVNTFAYNQILGGRLGVIDAQDLAIVGNYIEIGPGVAGTVVRMSGAIERVLFADNSVVRSKDAKSGTLMNLGSRRIDLALAADDSHVIDLASNTFTRAGHELQTGTGPIRVSPLDSGTLPGGLEEEVDYWAIKVNERQFRLDTNPPSEFAPVPVNITSLGTKRLQLTRVAVPRTVNISRNRFSTFRQPPDGQPLITITNASTVSFSDNDVASYVEGEVPVALKFESLDTAYKRQVAGWDVVGNRFRGDAKLPPRFHDRDIGFFDTCVSLAAGRDTVGNVRVAGNTFSGCRTQVLLHVEEHDNVPVGRFVRAPNVTGNIGEGGIVLEGVPAVLVGGNLGDGEPAGARFCGPAAPEFAAPVGSLYTRTGPGPDLARLWINTDGDTDWKALVVDGP